jgi:hypothetical protein
MIDLRELPGCFIEAPFGQKRIKKAKTLAFKENKIEAVRILDWLLCHPTVEQMIEAVAEAWRPSSLPLRGWAESIAKVWLWMPDNSDDYALAVFLHKLPIRLVFQQAPLSQESLDGYLQSFPKPPPQILRELALAAPGLSFDSKSCLLPPRCVERRMKAVRTWVDRMFETDREIYGEARYSTGFLDRCLMEIVSDPHGNWFLLGLDESIWFWDHEEVIRLCPCSITLEQLITGYLADPDCLYDNDFLGLDQSVYVSAEPLPGRLSDAERPLFHSDLREVSRPLPGLACIAVSVRGCLRALPSQHVSGLPDTWQAIEAEMLAFLNSAKQVSLTGDPVHPDGVKRVVKAAKRAPRVWDRIPSRLVGDLDCRLLSGFAVPNLVQACLAPAEPDKIEEAIAFCSNLMFRHRGNDKRSLRAAMQDVQYLLDLNLGSAGEMGKAVPPSFFERPLWRDGRQEASCIQLGTSG